MLGCIIRGYRIVITICSWWYFSTTRWYSFSYLGELFLKTTHALSTRFKGNQRHERGKLSERPWKWPLTRGPSTLRVLKLKIENSKQETTVTRKRKGENQDVETEIGPFFKARRNQIMSFDAAWLISYSCPSSFPFVFWSPVCFGMSEC